MAYEAAGVISRVFGWPTHDILDTKGKALTPVVPGVRFKVPALTAWPRVKAYAAYIRHLALLVADACAHCPQASLSADPVELRHSVMAAYGSCTLDAWVRYVWDLGIPVLGLDDPGALSGACFREKGRNVIVLTQRSALEARWTFDLLRELWHAAQEPEQPERTVLAYEDETVGTEDCGAIEERQAARRFAGAALLKGPARKLAQICLEEARYDLGRLKDVVAQVAARESVRLADLVNDAAVRWMAQNQDGWSMAASLQPKADPWGTVRRIFFDKFDFSRISERDREFVVQAVSPWEAVAYDVGQKEAGLDDRKRLALTGSSHGYERASHDFLKRKPGTQ